MSNIEFHRLEEHDYDKVRPKPSIICSFETERFGYVQVRMRRMQDKYQGDVINTWKFETLAQEPDLNMFTDKQIHRMEKLTRIVWRMVYDAPAMKERFDRNL
jgi:hypothetical protein